VDKLIDKSVCKFKEEDEKSLASLTDATATDELILDVANMNSYLTLLTLVCLLSIASVQTCRIEQLVCGSHVFAEFFKQASVKASGFDVIDNQASR